jgi:hypothetical protein
MRQYKVRVRFPSGKTFDLDIFRLDAASAARASLWIAYYRAATYDPQDTGKDRLPEGWGQMSEDEKIALATAAGYTAEVV